MPASVDQTLEQFRAYLEWLVAIQIDPRLRIDPALRSRFGWSDVINLGVAALRAAQTLSRLFNAEGHPATFEKLTQITIADQAESVIQWPRGHASSFS